MLFLTISIISLLFLPITILLSKLIYVLENPDTVFISLGNSWIETLPSISKFATFFPGVLSAILLFLSIYLFIMDNITPKNED